MAYPRHLRSRTMKKARRTAGDLTLNSTAWADVDTALDLTLNECQAGDEIIYGISAFVGLEAVTTWFDVVTVVSGTVTNSFAERGAAVASPGLRLACWVGVDGSYTSLSGEAPAYTVGAGDLTDGAITLRLRYASASATDKTLYAASLYPLDVWAKNLGPAQA